MARQLRNIARLYDADYVGCYSGALAWWVMYATMDPVAPLMNVEMIVINATKLLPLVFCNGELFAEDRTRDKD